MRRGCTRFAGRSNEVDGQGVMRTDMLDYGRAHAISADREDKADHSYFVGPSNRHVQADPPERKLLFLLRTIEMLKANTALLSRTRVFPCSTTSTPDSKRSQHQESRKLPTIRIQHLILIRRERLTHAINDKTRRRKRLQIKFQRPMDVRSDTIR